MPTSLRNHLAKASHLFISKMCSNPFCKIPAQLCTHVYYSMFCGTSLSVYMRADEKMFKRLCIKKKWQWGKKKKSGWRGRRAGIEIMSESVTVCSRCKSHRPPLSVIVQTFEVEPFSVRETRHLQRKWKECAILKEQLTLKWNLNLCQSHLNSDFQVRISFYQK